MDNFRFRRDLPEGKHKLADIFTGLELAPEIMKIFGEDAVKIKDLAVEITLEDKWGGKLEYAYIHDGGIRIGTEYIRTGPDHYIYLDMIHELTHIKQHWDGKELFDEKYSYVDRPTEIEAYKIAVDAAKRLGMNHEEISGYLEVPWASKDEMMRLEKSIGLR